VPEILVPVTNCYYFVLIITLSSMLAMWVIARSPFGLACQSTRENPTRTDFIGINVKKYQLIAFIFSGFFTGIAGALYVTFSRAVSPAYADFMKSGEFLLVCIIGGINYFIGPAVGALIYFVLDGIVTTFTVYWPLVLGGMLIFVCLFFRHGAVGFMVERYKVFAFRKKKSSVK
jgi:branched-chain amino acid transport system permease protein